ncbi:MAG: hypothetical protein OXS29_09935 [bacterium]|nr:hypothetical protein [bacterium]MDE0288736.1 hypothetical protein [bacterium]MDE0437257.1 hypothetical protein [bacterium]
MTEIERIRDDLNRVRHKVNVDGLEQVMSGIDAIKYENTLIRAETILSIMDGRAWLNGDFEYLMDRLNLEVGIMRSVSDVPGPDGGPYNRVLDEPLSSYDR